MNKNLSGFCGIYCGACTLSKEDFCLKEGLPVCKGCQAEDEFVFENCAKCEIRKCAKTRNISGCEECAIFPCDQLITFSHLDKPHLHEIIDNMNERKIIGEDNWLIKQAERWKCECGEEFTYYQKKCSKCGRNLEAYNL